MAAVRAVHAAAFGRPEEGRRSLDHDVVVVVGHPAFYPRFGFVPARPLGLRCEYPVDEEAFMVSELTPGALHGRRGVVMYAPAFRLAAGPAEGPEGGLAR